MREDTREEIVFVLDTKSECQVIHQGLKDPHFILNNAYFDSHQPSSPPDFAIRFWAQTRTPETPLTLPSNGRQVPYPFTSRQIILPPHWKVLPAFEVTEPDLLFIQKASERILDETSVPRILWDTVTRRRRAAKTILSKILPSGYQKNTTII